MRKRPNTSIKIYLLLLVPLNFAPIKTSSQIIAYHSQLSHKVPDHIHGTSTGFFPHRTNQAAKALRFGGLKKNSRTSTRRFSIFWFGTCCGPWGFWWWPWFTNWEFVWRCLALLGFLKYQASWGICKVEGVMVVKILDVIKGCWYHWWNKIALLQTQEKEFPFSCFQDQNTSDYWAYMYIYPRAPRYILRGYLEPKYAEIQL